MLQFATGCARKWSATYWPKWTTRLSWSCITVCTALAHSPTLYSIYSTRQRQWHKRHVVIFVSSRVNACLHALCSAPRGRLWLQGDADQISVHFSTLPLNFTLQYNRRSLSRALLSSARVITLLTLHFTSLVYSYHDSNQCVSRYPVNWANFRLNKFKFAS